MGDYQIVIIEGNLGADPETTTLPSGTEASRFPVAVNRVFTDHNGNTQKRTTWFRIYVTNYNAPACNAHLKKGRRVLVQGIMRSDENGNPRMYESKGKQRCSHEISAHVVNFGQEARPAQQQASKEGHQQPRNDGPDFPF